jgi:hypothetical protein
MPTRVHHRRRVYATLGAAGAHTYLAVIGAANLLDYTVPTKYEVLQQIADQDYWIWIHACCALLLVASLRAPRKYFSLKRWTAELPFAAVACNTGFTMMFVWAFFNLSWGLTAQRPVSLAGPGLAFFVAFGELILASAWTRGTYDKRR